LGQDERFFQAVTKISGGSRDRTVEATSEEEATDEVGLDELEAASDEGEEAPDEVGAEEVGVAKEEASSIAGKVSKRAEESRPTGADSTANGKANSMGENRLEGEGAATDSRAELSTFTVVARLFEDEPEISKAFFVKGTTIWHLINANASRKSPINDFLLSGLTQINTIGSIILFNATKTVATTTTH